MEIAEIRQKILTDDEFVLAEVSKLQYFYGLKNEIRYGLSRPKEDWTESVAEHIYSMHILVDYFLILEDLTDTLNLNKIKTIISWHDMDELETGDVISWKKSEQNIEDEKTKWIAVTEKLPELIKDNVYKLIEDYELRLSAEAKFVKAIDKIEPIFHMYNDKGKQWTTEIGLTLHNAERIKLPYVVAYPYIKRFMDVVHNKMAEEGFFAK